jgi:hypothetical protein
MIGKGSLTDNFNQLLKKHRRISPSATCVNVHHQCWSGLVRSPFPLRSKTTSKYWHIPKRTYQDNTTRTLAMHVWPLQVSNLSDQAIHPPLNGLLRPGRQTRDQQPQRRKGKDNEVPKTTRRKKIGSIEEWKNEASARYLLAIRTTISPDAPLAALGIETDLLPYDLHLGRLDTFIVAVVPLPDLLCDQDTAFSATEDILSDARDLAPAATTITTLLTTSTAATVATVAAEQQLKRAGRALAWTDKDLAHAAWVDELSAPDEQRPRGCHLAFAESCQWDVRDARVLP